MLVGRVSLVAALLSPCAMAEAPPAPSGDHLWFRSFAQGADSEGPYQCGEVDAALRMPPDIFHNQNGSGPIGLYVDYVVDRSWSTIWPWSTVETGRCADKDYTSPAAPAWVWSTWAPAPYGGTSVLMDELCQRACKCNSGSNR